jgi:hypothetical protein
MDESVEHKIRNLRLRILRAERELAASRHNVGLGAMLGAGHRKQMEKAGERERQRLEAERDELTAQLNALTGTPAKTPAVPPAPVESKAVEKKPAVREKTAAKTKKAAAAKTATAKKTRKK